MDYELGKKLDRMIELLEAMVAEDSSADELPAEDDVEAEELEREKEEQEMDSDIEKQMSQTPPKLNIPRVTDNIKTKLPSIEDLEKSSEEDDY